MAVVTHIGRMVALQDIGHRAITFTILGLLMVLASATAVIIMTTIGGTTIGVTGIMSTTVPPKQVSILRAMKHCG
jgi:hypothetical protein